MGEGVNQGFGVYAIFNDQSFNNKLTNDIISFEQVDLEFQTGKHGLSAN